MTGAIAGRLRKLEAVIGERRRARENVPHPWITVHRYADAVIADFPEGSRFEYLNGLYTPAEWAEVKESEPVRAIEVVAPNGETVAQAIERRARQDAQEAERRRRWEHNQEKTP